MSQVLEARYLEGRLAIPIYPQNDLFLDDYLGGGIGEYLLDDDGNVTTITTTGTTGGGGAGVLSEAALEAFLVTFVTAPATAQRYSHGKIFGPCPPFSPSHP